MVYSGVGNRQLDGVIGVEREGGEVYSTVIGG